MAWLCFSFFCSSFSFATPPSTTTTAGGAGPQAEGLLVPQVASNSATQRSNSRTPHALISDWPAYPLKHTLLAARVVFMNTHHHPNAAFMNTGRCNTRGSCTKGACGFVHEQNTPPASGTASSSSSARAGVRRRPEAENAFDRNAWEFDLPSPIYETRKVQSCYVARRK